MVRKWVKPALGLKRTIYPKCAFRIASGYLPGKRVNLLGSWPSRKQRQKELPKEGGGRERERDRAGEEKRRAEQSSKAEQSRAEQSRAEQSRAAEQSRREQSSAEQTRAEQKRATEQQKYRAAEQQLSSSRAE